MNGKPKESDWKRFRGIVPDLRERYLRQKNQELVDLLKDPKKTATEQFWDTLEEMHKEKKILCNCLDGHSRSKMMSFMLLMRRYGMLKESDLQGFSEDLQEKLSHDYFS
jgi:protein-tyrosine phosphatase